ncbi:hypothetical protein BJY52DRAFT_1194501 [Lactarius psammicola]|nr:hypothetical protein BJY52DRAFT_1194501 [Lactarius psammicola]
MSLGLGDSVQSQTEDKLAILYESQFLPTQPAIPDSLFSRVFIVTPAPIRAANRLPLTPPLVFHRIPSANRQIPPLPLPNSKPSLKSQNDKSFPPEISAKPKSPPPPSTDLPSHATGVIFCSRAGRCPESLPQVIGRLTAALATSKPGDLYDSVTNSPSITLWLLRRYPTMNVHSDGGDLVKGHNHRISAVTVSELAHREELA